MKISHHYVGGERRVIQNTKLNLKSILEFTVQKAPFQSQTGRRFVSKPFAKSVWSHSIPPSIISPGKDAFNSSSDGTTWRSATRSKGIMPWFSSSSFLASGTSFGTVTAPRRVGHFEITDISSSMSGKDLRKIFDPVLRVLDLLAFVCPRECKPALSPK